MQFGNEPNPYHPGWAIQLKGGAQNGKWIAYAHGFHIVADAFYAKVFDTHRDAEYAFSEVMEDYGEFKGYDCVPSIVVAWEPRCQQIRFRCESLQEKLHVNPDTIDDVIIELEMTIAALKSGGNKKPAIADLERVLSLLKPKGPGDGG